MVEGIGGRSPLAKEAIEAALRAQAEQAASVRSRMGSDDPEPSQRVTESAFPKALEQGLAAVDADVRNVEELPQQLLNGKLDDFHEVAVQLKRAEFSFRFAMEIRNKLIDAYREVMRMNV